MFQLGSDGKSINILTLTKFKSENRNSKDHFYVVIYLANFPK